MRVISVDQSPGAAHAAAKPRGLWQRLAQTLDDYLGERTERAAPDAAFRRSRHEIDGSRRLVLKGALTPAHGSARASVAYVRFPPRPDPRVLSTSIPLFFIGRNKYGLWVVRAAEGRAGGIFLLKRSALRFAAKKSAPAGCATMFLSERFELDVENQGSVLAGGLDAVIRTITAPTPPPAPVIASRKPPRHRRAA